jgi:hypothetical protein
MRCPQVIEAGVYVLGALSPAERFAYQRHLATCSECRNEVADLAGLPGLLGRLDEATAAGLSGPDDASYAEPAEPPALLATVLGTVRAERARSRRRYRWRMAAVAAAAACLALLGGFGASSRSHPARLPDGVVLASMDAVQQGEPVTAVIGYQAAQGGGTDIYMSCLYADATGGADEWSFQLVVYPRRGSPTMARRWDAYPGQYRQVVAHADWAPSDIARIEVQLANGTRLLAYQVT